MLFLIILLLLVIIILIRPGLLSNTIALILFVCACAWLFVIAYEEVNWASGMKTTLISLAWIAAVVGCFVIVMKVLDTIEARKVNRQRNLEREKKSDV
jgi:hypothetical protein